MIFIFSKIILRNKLDVLKSAYIIQIFIFPNCIIENTKIPIYFQVHSLELLYLEPNLEIKILQVCQVFNAVFYVPVCIIKFLNTKNYFRSVAKS